MDERRADLGLRWLDVAEAAGLTTEGLRGIRYGTGEIRSLTKRGLEDALKWARGSVNEILAGRDPTPIQNGDEPGLHAVPEVGDERLDRLEDAARKAAAMLQEIEDGIADLRGRERDSGT
jgi:hypothetical protein